MKTRTLLLLSVGTALMILVAGGVLLFQLRSQSDTVASSALGERITIGDLAITVFGSSTLDTVFAVEVEIGGVDDDLTGFSLVTGDRRLEPLIDGTEGGCAAVTVEPQRCRLDFDTTAVTSSNRTLVVVRGDDQANWSLGT
jgi:hypothetical protein